VTEPATGSTILPVTGPDGRPRAGSSSTGAGKPSRWSQFFATPARATLAAIAVIVVVLALWIWRSTEQLLPGAFWPSWWLQVPDLLLALGVGLVVGSIVVVLARLVRRRLPWLLVCVLVFGAVLLFTMGAGASLVGWLVIAVVALAASATWGWFLGTLRGRDRPHRYSAAGWTGFGVTTVAALLVVGYLVWPGPGANPTAAATPSGAMTDPAAPGPFRVISTAYGGGKSAANPGYGPGVAITTKSVDASALIKGWESGSTRSEIWGFTAADLPLNALVWAPDGPGPFPLVVMLHGNTPFDDSEAGFEYLGTLLASRGYLVAPIGEGFLNTGLLDKANSISGAGTARAWLLLQHLHEWKTLNATAGGPFAGRVDLSRVSLLGHSRGGEAVALAAAQRAQLDAQGKSSADPDVAIRTVIALAPSNGQAGGKPLQLTGVNYLTLGGTDVADVGTFAGDRQYARTNVDHDLVKAAVAVDRANHTQFNSRWGRRDVGIGAAKYQLATGPLLSREDQRKVAEEYVSAFLDLTIKKQNDRLGLFDGTVTDPSWLPRTIYVQQFAQGTATAVQGFDAGTDLSRTSIGTVKTTGAGQPQALPTRTGPSTNLVLPLSWVSGAPPAQYAITEIRPGALTEKSFLTADLANAGAATLPVRVSMTDAAGHRATIPFGAHPDLRPIITGRVLKPLLPGGSVAEPLLRTFRLPLSSASARGIDLATVTTLAISFTTSGAATVYLDNVGVTAS